MVQDNNIKGRQGAKWFLFFLSPILGELLSGSSPPPEFFSPIGFVFMTILYGGGALLIREARVRWKMGWSIIFLAIAYGILEEGVMVQSFFNHHHADLDKLSRYGMFMGVQWPWGIWLTMYHATISTTIPIMMTDLLFPKLKEVSFLKKKGIITFIVLLVVEVLIFTIWLNHEYGSIDDPYVINVFQIMIWTLITIGFVYLGYKYRDKRRVEREKPIKKPITFAVLGFLFQIVGLVFGSIMAENNAPAIITVAIQIVIAVLAIRFVFKQMYNGNITVKHKLALIFGSLMTYILLTLIYEYEQNMPMIEVGAVSFVLIIVYTIVVNIKMKRLEVSKI